MVDRVLFVVDTWYYHYGSYVFEVGGTEMMLECMIVGVRVAEGGNGETLEIEAVPLILAKKKMSLLDIQHKLMDGADMQQVLNENMTKQYRHKIYLPRQQCSDEYLIPFRSIILEINLADKNKIQDKYATR